MLTCRALGPFKIVTASQHATTISEHATPADAFREIDRLMAARATEPGAAFDELIVVDAEGVVVPRLAIR